MTSLAEQCVIASVLMDNSLLDESGLKKEDFDSEAHRRLWAAFNTLASTSTPIDQVTLSESLSGRLDGYLEDLSGMLGSTANFQHHCKMVKDESKSRQIKRIGRALERTDKSPSEVVQLAVDALEDLGSEEESGLEEISPIVKEVFENADNPDPGIPTGISGLDRKIGGFKPGAYIVLAARPSMGKTALLVGSFLRHNLKEGRKVSFFSVESTKQEIVQRLLASEGKVNLANLVNGRLTPSEWSNLTETCGLVEKYPLMIDDQSHTIMQFRSRLKRAEQDLIAVDYLQLMSGDGDTRNEVVSGISRNLKLIAKANNVPLIALSQLSRGVEMRAGGKPKLSDLRDSGSIEQDADVVIFIGEDETTTYLDVAKNRNGPTGVVPVQFIKPIVRFYDKEADRGF